MECGFDEGCQVDGYYLNESMTGLGRRGGAEMPREPHRGGRDVHGRGISNDKVCVACGVADDGCQFAELCDLEPLVTPSRAHGGGVAQSRRLPRSAVPSSHPSVTAGRGTHAL